MPVPVLKQPVDMDGFVDTRAQKYDEAAEVQRQVKVLVECMHQHFRVVHAHIVVEIDGKVAETGESVCEGSPYF